MISIADKPLQVSDIVASVYEEGAGAVNVFIGTVRNKTQEKKVVKLEFEAYKTMALKELTKISDHILKTWPIKKVAIHHRIGSVQIGEEAVVIAVSGAHRKESFEACQYAIDTLKHTVPIWKKEIFEDGEEWVSAHP